MTTPAIEAIQSNFSDRDVNWEVLNKTTAPVYTRPVVTVLMSGGVESTTLAAWYKRRRYDVVGLFVDYGQPWMTEEVATMNVARYLDIQLVKFKMNALPGIHMGEDDSEYSMGFVGMRNPILISIAMNFSFAAGYKLVGLGVEKSVHPDCSPEFVDRFNFMTESAFGDAVNMPVLTTPFVDMTKSEVVREAKKVHAPMHLTWSCMIDDTKIPQDFRYGVAHQQFNSWMLPANCGRCPSCLWRLECYRLANLVDPASYAIDTTSLQRKGARPFPYYSPDQWLKEVDRSSTRIQKSSELS